MAMPSALSALLVCDIQLVHGIELELDFFPCFHGDLEFGAVIGGGSQNLFAFFLNITAFVTRLYASF